MQPLCVVKEKISPQTLLGFTDRPILMKIDLFILDCPPQPLDKNIIIHPAATIHADLYLTVLKKTCKFLAAKLHSLVGVENLRPGSPEGFPQSFPTEPGIQRVGELPRQNITAIPVHDRH